MTAIAVSWSPRPQDYLKDLTDCEWSGRPDSNREPLAPKPAGAISWKSFFFNLVFENKRVRKIFGRGTVCRNVAHA